MSIDESESLLALYPTSPLFQGIGAPARARLRELSTTRHYQPGEAVVTEGTADPYLYLIKHGRARVDKAASDGAGGYALSELTVGQTIGEMKLVAPAPSSATVVALEPLDVVCVDIARLRAEPDPTGLLQSAQANIARILSERLRGISALTADTMQAEIAQGRLRESAGRFIVYLFAVMSGFAFFIAGLDSLGSRRPSQLALSLLVIGGVTIPITLLLRGSIWERAVYGLTLANWRKTARDAVLYTLPVLAVVTLLKGILILAVPADRGQPLFDLHATLDGPFSLAPWLTGIAVYAALTPLQELFARSALQASLQLFIPRPNGQTNWSAIVIANLIFASAHTYLGVPFMLAAFIPGLFWGWLFARQRSLLGVSISHVLVGVWSLFVVGVQVVVGGK